MGRKADFRNTIVLLTSNLGARFLAGQSTPLGFAAGSEAVFEKQSAQAIEEAKKWFRPELAGRLDEMIVFRPLADDSLCAIAEKMLCQLEQRAARSGYQLHHTPRVGQALAAKARSAYGARELRRAVDRAVEQALADQIASGTACGSFFLSYKTRGGIFASAIGSGDIRSFLCATGSHQGHCENWLSTGQPFRKMVFSVIIEAIELQEEVHAHIVSFEPNCR